MKTAHDEALASNTINIYGAKTHNLKDIHLQIPRNALVVFTGLSGSGKSSLAFDTIFAEGQRRYIETFSAYARHFLGNMQRPDVDKITGLSPVIAIEQKTTNKNPRSTVGTTTEIYDFLRLLFARAGEAYSYLSGQKMVKYTPEQVLQLILQEYNQKKIYLLSPLVRGRKGHYKELFEQTQKRGYLHVRVDGDLREIIPGMRVDRYKIHHIEAVIDRLKVTPSCEERLRESLKTAMKMGDGLVMILDLETQEVKHFSNQLMCPSTGLSYGEPAPNLFSYNSPQGACSKCKGLGVVQQIDIKKIIPNPNISIHAGGIVPLGKYKNSLFFHQIEAICEKHGASIKTPISELPDETIDEIIFGTDRPLPLKNSTVENGQYLMTYEGIARYISLQQESEAPASAQKWANQFISSSTCPQCQGQRLNQEALHYKIGDKNIAELAQMDIKELYQWISDIDLHLNQKQRTIALEVKKEMTSRLQFLLDVGLNYLSLNRASHTLSGGESQRIRLASQIGSQLVNVLYILDEPSIGLHQRDNDRLINSLKKLRDNGNSVLVVEHDKDMMLEADYIVDIGPQAGVQGGKVVFAGTPQQMMKTNTLTAQYLHKIKSIDTPSARREGNGKQISLKGACGHNLKNVSIDIPLGTFCCITGVSGSGKSSLIHATLLPIVSKHLYRTMGTPLPYKQITGIEHIDKVISVDQSPIGRTPRSNPATYTGVFSDIRNLFAQLPEAKVRGYKAGRFSFNMKSGRCPECSGNGYKTIEMNFLPDVHVPCPECHTKRYNRETLEVRYKGKSIADVLSMTIDDAVSFFDSVPSILHKIKVLQEVGLGYLQLGQPSNTLSGGEAQRIKLATELARPDTGNTLYILDEPTTGLHFEDIKALLKVLNLLVNKGNTVIVIEHNLDLIKCADYIIDMGVEGGTEGGQLIAQGTPESIISNPLSHTAKYLAQELR